MEPPSGGLQAFRARGDSQIMGLELLAISLGLATFKEYIAGRNVVVHSDNTGSEVRNLCVVCMVCNRVFQVSIRRGTARSLDHAQLVHHQWLFIAEHGINLFVKRVGTKYNIADLPSRKASFCICAEC